MTNKTRNRCIHVAGLVLCLGVFSLTCAESGVTSVITATIAVIGFIGNAYGIWCPVTWFRKH